MLNLEQIYGDNINKLNNEGKTIIITTHYLHEAEELCNEIAIIDNGNLITKDTTSNIKSLIDRKTNNYFIR